MARISKKVKNMIESAINNLDDNIKDKCSLCNITLTDVVKKVEVSTGASTNAVCTIISSVINEGRPDYEYVSTKALINRIRRSEGKEDLSVPKRDIKKLSKSKNIIPNDFEEVAKLQEQLAIARKANKALKALVDKNKQDNAAMPTFQSPGNNDELQQLKEAHKALQAEHKAYVQMAEDIINNFNEPAKKEMLSPKEEQQRFIEETNKKRLKEYNTHKAVFKKSV